MHNKTAIELATFNPTQAQQEAKARLHVALEEGPMPPSWTLAAAQALLPNETRLERWWREPGFKEWLTDTETFKVMAELASWEALQTCRDIMANSEEKAVARINAAKLTMEIAGKINKRVQERYMDKSLEGLSKEELRAVIDRNVKRLKKVN